jgi:hypothetical protein
MEPYTLASVNELITYDPSKEMALKTQQYSCVLSHVVSRPKNSNYIISPTPGFRVLFIGEMIPSKKNTEEFDFNLLYSFNMTHTFLSTRGMLPEETIDLKIENIVHSRVFSIKEGEERLQVILECTGCQIYNIEFVITEQEDGTKKWSINNKKTGNLNTRILHSYSDLRKVVFIPEWEVLLLHCVSVMSKDANENEDP